MSEIQNDDTTQASATQSYGDDSIELQKGESSVRLRPAVMLGSDGLDGARHGFSEMSGNALDEYSCLDDNDEKHKKQLDIKYWKDGSLSIRDYGRGVPMGWNTKEQNWNWHCVYNILYGGAKYETHQARLQRITDWSTFNDKDYNYLYSVGLNGLGAASTQFTSEYFEVESYKEGECKRRSYRRGRPVVNGETVNLYSGDWTIDKLKALPEEVSKTDEPDGTYVHWKPDDTIFSDTNIGIDWLISKCKDIAKVAHVTINIEDEHTGQKYVFEKGTIQDLVVEYAGSNAIRDDEGNPIVYSTNTFTHGNIKVNNNPFVYVFKCDIAFTPVTAEVDTVCFHNSVRMTWGSQYDAVNSALGAFFNSKAKSRGVKLEATDYSDSFGVVVSSQSNYASFRGQTKDAVDNSFIYTAIQQALLEKLEVEYGKGNEIITDAVERVIREAEIRIASKETAKIMREAKKVAKEKTPEKFTSCDAYENKEYDKAELWITEGDSAKGSIKNARNKAFQAIYPIKGKGINVAKKSLNKVLKNKKIREIFALIGTGFDLNIRGEKTFNIEDLRFDKIIFATDADEDGYQIRVLLFLVFYKLAPQLIQTGHVYIAETPRFRIDLTDNTYRYAKDDKERDAILKECVGRIKKVSRFKGLGEVNADVLRETTVHPDTRNLIPININLANQDECDLIDAVFGADKYKQRKSIITSVLGCDLEDVMDDDALVLQEDEDDEDEDSLDEE